MRRFSNSPFSARRISNFRAHEEAGVSPKTRSVIWRIEETSSMKFIRLLVFLAATGIAVLAADSVTLNWLGGVPPAAPNGVNWGVPWPKGAVSSSTAMRLVDADGRRLEVQTWPLAYWPDGSLKWTGHAIAATAGMTCPFTIEPGEVAAPKTPIKTDQTAGAITIDTGAIACTVKTTGTGVKT